ncbi:MAG: prefoldin subunit [Candidatus Woesearchaeota archaeon]
MSQKDIEQLRLIEQNLSQTVAQKQGYQRYLYDIDSALKELGVVEEGYQIVGTIMIKKSSENLRKDLEEKKEIYSKRLEALEKQEKSLRQQAKTLQEQAMDGFSESENNS